MKKQWILWILVLALAVQLLPAPLAGAAPAPAAALTDAVLTDAPTPETAFTNTAAAAVRTEQAVPTEEEAYGRMIALKESYPEGMEWTNANGYAWNGGIFTMGFGCAGFAFILSDAAFGTLPARVVTYINFDAIRVGDILRVNNDSHSVVILERYADHVVLAEGNYNSSIHWGRTMTRAEVEDATYYMTRYPEEHLHTHDEHVDPTCTEPGYDRTVCDDCGEVLSMTTLPALGHDVVADAAVDATCTETGLTAGEHCTRCDYAVAQEVLPALGHDLVTEPALPATCTETGLSAGEYCTRCDYKVEQEIEPALGHDWSEGEITADPTPTEDGVMTFTCSRCSATKVEIIPATGEEACKHEHASPEQKDATCTEDGYDRMICDDCGKTVSEVRVPALGHYLIDHEAQAATCTEVGWEAYQNCARCDYTTYVELPALGHNIMIFIFKPDCTSAGHTNYACVREGCGYSEIGETIDPLGHDYVDHEGKEPTCTEPGWPAYQTCSRCRYTSYQTIEALGHAFENGVCTRCGEKDPTYTPPVTPSGFYDVSTSAWFYDAVYYAVANGLMNGVGNNRFAPNDPMTRAMLVTVLWRYEGSEEDGSNIFSDVPYGQWYSDAVAWAAFNGIVDGVGGGRFAPTGNITREQMAAILYRYANQKGLDTSGSASLAKFPDARKVSSWAQAAMEWAVAEGIISGSDGLLDPQGNATRAQVATILMRFIEDFVKAQLPAPTEPTEAPTEPTEPSSIVTPPDIPTEPTEETSEPTEDSSEPTEVTSAPTDEPTEPTDEPTEPTEAPTEPTEAPTEPTERPADALPDFTVQTITGEEYSLYKELETHDLVVINLFATWCGPCRMEFPYLQEAWEQSKDRVSVIALSVETTDTDAKLTTFASGLGLTLPIGHVTDAGLSAYETGYIPTTLVVDRTGRVVATEIGAKTSTKAFLDLFAKYLP